MGADTFNTQRWTRTSGGKIILRLIEEWDAGVTEHGDIAVSFTSIVGNDPVIPAGESHRSQFICTREDAKQIAHMILRTLAFSEAEQACGFTAFRKRIRTPALRALADDWNAARGDRRMPSWEDIKPSPDAPYLSTMWGFDFDRRTDTFTGRMAGKSILLGFGKNLLGTPLRDLHPPHVFETLQAQLLRLVSEPACVRYSGMIFKANEQIVEGERVVLPIGADPQNPDGILGASYYYNFPLLHTPTQLELLCDDADWCSV